MRKRHLFFYTVLRPFVELYILLKFGYRGKKQEALPETFIILSNHTTDFDMLFVACSFREPMYFVGSEHIARRKTLYKFLQYAFAPIMRRKGTSAASTVMEVLRTVRKGYNVCIFAEGARSWNGVTAPILPSTGKMVKSARCALVTFKLQGGYFVSPRWSEGGTRRGPISGSIVNVYTKEQLKEMSVAEINDAISKDLYEDAYARQLQTPARYKGKQIAYRMESMLFHCPNCRRMHTLTSVKDTISCNQCGMSFRYTEYGMLEGEGMKHKTVKELFSWQSRQVEQDASAHVTYTAPDGVLKTIENHVETVAGQGAVSMDEETLTCGNVQIPMEQIADMDIHGKYALVFSADGTYYELIPDRSVGALKFHMLYQAYKYGAVNKFNEG